MGRRVRTCLALCAGGHHGGGALACSVVPEEKIVRDFFRASRLRDNAALGAFATTNFDPNRDGQVTEFKVLNVGAEHSSPLAAEEVRQRVRRGERVTEGVREGEVRVSAQQSRGDRRIEKLEASNAPVPKKDATVQATWSKWRDDELKHLKAVSDARVTLGRMKSVAEVSLSKPNGPTPDVAHYEGDVIEKDITVDAKVKLPDGQTVQKNLVVTAARTVMKNEKGETLTGRWIITSVKEAQAPKTS